MAVIRLPQQYANDRFAEQIREASQTIGELVIFVKMYHAWIDDPAHDHPDEFPHCPRCWDSFYNESTDPTCPVCGGTGYSKGDSDRGIQEFGRAWAIISDNTYTQPIIRQRGQWSPDDRIIQLEGGIEPSEHDYVRRVKKWSSDFRPLVLGDAYRLDNPSPYSLRSGNEAGQVPGQNTIGYRFTAHLLRLYQIQLDFPSDQPIPRITIPTP